MRTASAIAVVICGLLSVFAAVAATDDVPVRQNADGVITFTNAPGGDVASWTFRTTRSGRYHLRIHATDEVARDSVRVSLTLGDRVQHARHGERIDVPREGELTVRLIEGRPDTVQRIELYPAPEGDPIVQSSDRSITLHARDATIHGTRLRFERDPKKNTLGYWTQATDWASWDFIVKEGGQFIIFAMQGAPGGGSQVDVVCAGQTLKWTVADTGSFHTFTFVELGRVTLDQPGEYTLAVKPQRKAGVAVMDLRQIILVPVLP